MLNIKAILKVDKYYIYIFLTGLIVFIKALFDSDKTMFMSGIFLIGSSIIFNIEQSFYLNSIPYAGEESEDYPQNKKSINRKKAEKIIKIILKIVGCSFCLLGLFLLIR